jgi:hypothetical protein
MPVAHIARNRCGAAPSLKTEIDKANAMSLFSREFLKLATGSAAGTAAAVHFRRERRGMLNQCSTIASIRLGRRDKSTMPAITKTIEA